MTVNAKQPVRAQRFTDIAELREQRVAGSIELCSFDDIKSVADIHGIRFICPCGCSNESWVPVNRANHGGPNWQISGGLDDITLYPSVFNTGLPCRWHGWLKEGVWTPC